MQYTINIPDALVPGIIAISHVQNVTPQDVVDAYAEAAANKACQDMQVGPYWKPPGPPQFNPDGTPYVNAEAAPEGE